MRIRAAAIAVSIWLLIAAAGCSKKPDDSAAAASPGTAASGTTSSGTSSSPAANPAAVAQPVAPKRVTVPEGTVLSVRLNDTVSSKNSNAGDRFTAVIEEPVEVGGKVVIPKGASATGTVTDAKSLGKIKGAASLRLELNSISVRDAKYEIQTSAVARTEKGKGKRTAEFGGGGAALGGIIGGLAGGGKGAAIGILAGGGAGVAGGAYTGNKDIVLPAETMLTFKLLHPVEVKM